MTTPPAPFNVAVVGSTNLDIWIHAQTRPQLGETVIGDDYSERCGGKGANQALAAAASGATVALITAVGADDAGSRLTRALATSTVRVIPLERPSRPTGRAIITTTPDGENTIIVVPGASEELSARFASDSLDANPASVILTQAEINLHALAAAATWAENHAARFVLNASPIRPGLERHLARADPLIVNLHEAAALTGLPAEIDSLFEQATRLSRTARSVVITAGGHGAVYALDGTCATCSGHPVTVVDTTGAGDAFAGALTAALSQHADLPSAVAHGCVTGARAVQLPGANQLSL